MSFSITTTVEGAHGFASVKRKLEDAWGAQKTEDVSSELDKAVGDAIWNVRYLAEDYFLVSNDSKTHSYAVTLSGHMRKDENDQAPDFVSVTITRNVRNEVAEEESSAELAETPDEAPEG